MRRIFFFVYQSQKKKDIYISTEAPFPPPLWKSKTRHCSSFIFVRRLFIFYKINFFSFVRIFFQNATNDNNSLWKTRLFLRFNTNLAAQKKRNETINSWSECLIIKASSHLLFSFYRVCNPFSFHSLGPHSFPLRQLFFFLSSCVRGCTRVAFLIASKLLVTGWHWVLSLSVSLVFEAVRLKNSPRGSNPAWVLFLGWWMSKKSAPSLTEREFRWRKCPPPKLSSLGNV